MMLKNRVREEVEIYRAKEMECTRFSCGMLMNYLAAGYRLNHPHAVEMMEGLEDPPIMWDILKGKAELPMRDDRSFPNITMTTIEDVGRFVAAACELLEGMWKPVMSMAGETISESNSLPP